MKWITDKSEIWKDSLYIVCAIGQRADKSTYLYKPQIMSGWQFQSLLAGCYAAIPMPEWKGLPTCQGNLKA